MDKRKHSVLSLTVGCMLMLLFSAQHLFAWPCTPTSCPTCETCMPTGCECLADCGCGGRTCPDCWDCVSCNCECDITVNSISSDDFACVDCDVTFTADVTGSCSCVDWSGGGDPSSESGSCTFTTKWDTPGVKTVTATPDCGDSAKQKQVTVVKVDIIQYNDPDTGWTDIQPSPAFALYVYKGTTVTFKAIPDPSGGSWPSDKPVWGGSSGASGTGETCIVTFSTLSSSLTDYKTVTATCGNTITIYVIVFDFDGVFTPYDDFDGRHTMYYGIEEKVGLSFETDPWSVTAGQAGGLKWTKGSGPGKVSNAGNDGLADYDAKETNGTVWLILTIQYGPSKGKWEGYQKDVILPTGTRMTMVDPTHVWHINNTASAGIKLYYWLDPTHVSFKYLTFGEDACPATSAWGVFSGIGPHAQNTFGTIMGGNITNGCRVQLEDHAWCQVVPWNAGDGGFTWNIPTQYIDDTSTRNTFGSTQNHVSRVWVNGDATQSKGGHSRSAAAADPSQPW